LSTEFRLAETIPEDGHSDRNGSGNIQLNQMSFVAAKDLLGANEPVGPRKPPRIRCRERRSEKPQCAAG
jgi:hypothetical protein